MLTVISYTFQWLVTLPLELVAASITIRYWGSPLKHHAAWVTIFLVAIAGINHVGAKFYADVEAFLSICKVVAVIGFLYVRPISK